MDSKDEEAESIRLTRFDSGVRYTVSDWESCL